MKKILLLLVALVCTTMSFAQNTLVATLTHGDEIKMFYGVYAFRDAHNAAENGDIINLSAGKFTAVDITKALVIRGAGADGDNPTYISGNFYLRIPEDVTDRLSLEGCKMDYVYVYRTLKNPYFMKCKISGIKVSESSNSVKNHLVNCCIANCELSSMEIREISSVQFVNSYVNSYLVSFSNSSNVSTATFVNCVIRPHYGDDAQWFSSSELINCILCWTKSDNATGLPATSSAINCVAVGYDRAFSSASTKNCKYANLDIFKDSNMKNDLTDEAKEKYLGNDGTPVGMYGGIMPFDMTPSYPLITKMNVANKTTADGKLSVDIEVSAAK